MSAKPKRVQSIRVDPEMIEQAKRLGLDLSEIYRKALQAEIAKHRGLCPACGGQCKEARLKDTNEWEPI